MTIEMTRAILAVRKIADGTSESTTPLKERNSHCVIGIRIGVVGTENIRRGDEQVPGARGNSDLDRADGEILCDVRITAPIPGGCRDDIGAGVDRTGTRSVCPRQQRRARTEDPIICVVSSGRLPAAREKSPSTSSRIRSPGLRPRFARLMGHDAQAFSPLVRRNEQRASMPMTEAPRGSGKAAESFSTSKVSAPIAGPNSSARLARAAMRRGHCMAELPDRLVVLRRSLKEEPQEQER